MALSRVGARRGAVYTDRMEVRDAEKDTAASVAAQDRAVEPAVMDPVAHLAAVYRDYPGLRALIMRRVRDPQLAADILQDAAVTTLEKLRAGEIAQPSSIGGYLYRVALNHLRNHRRKDRAAVSSSEDLESVPDGDDEPESMRIARAQWALAAREMLAELPTVRDRELLMRFYLNDESKELICASLGLSDEHFNRVIFRARNRFRGLLERRGYAKLDFLSLAALGLIVNTVCSAPALGPAPSPTLRSVMPVQVPAEGSIAL
jgi:RNA polymerase sigma-70 factor (ECF subfamily)